MRIELILATSLALAFCGTGSARDFAEPEWRVALAASYVEYLTYADPVYASRIGIHGTTDDPAFFDRQLTDMSVEAWAARYDTHRFLRETLAAVDAGSLSEEDRVDHHILQFTVARLANMIGPGSLHARALPAMLADARLPPAIADEIREDCGDAVAAIAEFREWFVAEIVPRPDGPWRIGRRLYEQQYRYQMDYPLSPDELLAAAEQDLELAYADVIALARLIHDGYLRDAIAAGSVRPASELTDREVAGNVFARIAEDHSTADTLIADSYALADAIVGFVEDNDLIDLSPTSKLRIENIPAHLSGYAVALMIDKGFQEPAEARGKLKRAKFGAVQLATYYAGYRAILGILDEYRALKGDAFALKDFNERLIGAGSPPFFALRDYMLRN